MYISVLFVIVIICLYATLCSGYSFNYYIPRDAIDEFLDEFSVQKLFRYLECSDSNTNDSFISLCDYSTITNLLRFDNNFPSNAIHQLQSKYQINNIIVYVTNNSHDLFPNEAIEILYPSPLPNKLFYFDSVIIINPTTDAQLNKPLIVTNPFHPLLLNGYNSLLLWRKPSSTKVVHGISELLSFPLTNQYELYEYENHIFTLYQSNSTLDLPCSSDIDCIGTICLLNTTYLVDVEHQKYNTCQPYLPSPQMESTFQELNILSLVFLFVCHSIPLLICLYLLIIFFIYREHPVIKRNNPIYDYLIISGVLMIALSGYCQYYLENGNNILASLFIHGTYLGPFLLLLGLFAKSFRVYIIVKNPLSTHLPDKIITIVLILSVLLYLIFLIIILSTQKSYIEIRYDGPYYDKPTLNNDNIWTSAVFTTRFRYSLQWNLYLTLIFVIYLALLYLADLYLTIQLFFFRYYAFNTSRENLFILFILLIMASLISYVRYLSTEIIFICLMQSLVMSIFSSAVLLEMYLPRFARIWRINGIRLIISNGSVNKYCPQCGWKLPNTNKLEIQSTNK